MRIKHRSLIGITLLTILTFGIYPLYWYFITKTEMNVVNGKSAKVPFFLLIFIPIINIWWFWRFAKAIEKTTRGALSRWGAFVGPIFLTILSALLLVYVFGPYNGGGIITLSRAGYSLVAVILGLLPIYYFQSNLNKYAK